MNTTHKIVLAAFLFLVLAMFFGKSGYRMISKYSKKVESYVLSPSEIACPNCITGKCDQHGKCS